MKFIIYLLFVLHYKKGLKNMLQKESVSLLDIIDLDFLQNFQDSFSKSLNIAIIMVDDKGPITKPSNFTDFCIRYTRGSELGYKKCNECDIQAGKAASKEGKPIIYDCHAGLTDFAVPIMLNGNHIASILGGQVLTREPDENQFRKTGNKLGIDEDLYIEELKKIKILSKEQVQSTADLLFIFSNYISELASKNFELKIKSKRELLIRKVTENIRSSLDINKTLNYVCDELAQTFNVQRATIIQYHDNENYSKFEVRREYKSDPNIIGILDNPSFNFRVGEIWAKALEGEENCLVIDNIQQSEMPEFFKENYISIGQKSIVIAPIEKDFEKWGVIILSEYNYNRHWTKEEISLLKIISNQVYVAIKQSELYLSLQKKAMTENVLSQIMASCVSTFDFEKQINSIVTKTGEFFKADRCFFTEHDITRTKNLPIKDYAEYRSSEDIRSHRTRPMNKADTSEFVKMSQKKMIEVVNDITKIELPEASRKMLIEDLSVKSYVIAPIYYKDDVYGSLVIHYVKDFKKFEQSEIDLLQAIANNSAAVIRQSKLYSEIEKNEKYTRNLLNSINDVIITINNDFVIESCNPSIENVWGYESSECIGKPLKVLLNYNYDNSKKIFCLDPNSIFGIRKNGEKFPVELNISSSVIDNKNVNLLVIRDITERKKIEQMKNEFVSMVSHELRTPLTSIRGALGLVTSGKIEKLSDKTKGLLDIANNNCLRLINLINDILDIEKIEAGKMDFKITTVELVSLVENAIQANSQFANKFGVKIKFKKDINKVFVEADNNRLIQVVTNLLSNAIKFSKQNLPVDVVIAKSSSKNDIRVSITNYGPEISTEFKDRIFQKFAQEDASDSRQKGGTGLGLSISKAIIEKLHGEIGYVSKNSETTFYFDLPEISENNKGKMNEQMCSDM